MRPTLGHAPTSTPTGRRPVERVLLIVVALALAASWLLLVQEPARVSLTIHNPTPCAVWVDVASGDGQGTIAVGAIPAGADRIEPRLLDRGPIYRFSFSVAGAAAGTEAVRRDQLEAKGWRYDLPSRPELSPSGCLAN